MPTIEDLTEMLITWLVGASLIIRSTAHTEPSPDQLHQASDLADELSEVAFMEDTEIAHENAILIIGLLWPASN